MRLNAIRYGLGLLLGGGLSQAPAQSREEIVQVAAEIPLESFFARAPVAQPRISPDGRRIAFLQLHEDRVGLGVFDRETGGAQLILQAVKEDFDAFFWKGNEHLVYFAELWQRGAFYYGLTDLSGHETKKIQPHLVGYEILDNLFADPERIVIDDGAVRYSNLITGERTVIHDVYIGDGDYNYTELKVDGAGSLRFARRGWPEKALYEYVHRRNGDDDWTVYHREPVHGLRQTLTLLAPAQNGEQAYLISRHEKDRGGLYAFDFESNGIGELIFEAPKGEVTGIILSPTTRSLVAATFEDAKKDIHWFDDSLRQLDTSLKASFPGLEVEVQHWSLTENVFMVKVFSDREPGVWFVVDRSAGRVDQFARVRPGIDPALMSAQIPIAFGSTDGVTINGYLTLPHLASQDAPAPLVVLAKEESFGSRWRWGYNATVQFLASRGYAVLQVNPRGSVGYGANFLELGRYELGRGMMDELEAGIDWAVDQGMVDGSRVAIMGGYEALAGVTLRPERFVCAINNRGISDLEIAFRPQGADAWRSKDDYDFRNRWVGETKAQRSEVSPVENVENIQVPTLHRYVKGDPDLRPEHWERLRRQLKKHRKPFEEVFERPERPGFQAETARLDWYRKVEAFLAKHL